MEKITRTLLIGYDSTVDEDGKENIILIVGTAGSPDEKIKIMNFFSGEEAEELYNKLISVKGGDNENDIC